LAKAQEAIAKANAGALRAERHLKSAKRNLKLAGQRDALEAEKAAVSVRTIEGRTLQQIGDEWGSVKTAFVRSWSGQPGWPPGGRPTSTVAPRASPGSLWSADERARISRLGTISRSG
jgi:hypothetical protein